MLWLGFADQAEPDPAAPHLEEDDLEEVRASDEINEVLVKMLPWAISLLLHMAVVLLAIFIVWSVKSELNQEHDVVPDARLVKRPGQPLTMRRTQHTTRSSSSRRSVARSRSTTSSLVSTSKQSLTKVIGTVGAAGGSTSPFGSAIQANSGFAATMFGVGGNAKKICYVIDASGSLIDTLDYVINELKRSINELSEQQSFTVFFFQGDRVVEVPPRKLKQATAENRQKVKDWISGNIVPGFGTNPVSAIEKALNYQPDLVFLLSDNITGRGIYQTDQKDLLKAIRRANVRSTKINTIQFIYPDPLLAHGHKATMELIAADNGGQYKFLDGRELGIE